jgi:arylsulfatase A-like enzyme
VTAPKNVCVVLLDSLNRHMLGAYGGEEFSTPNLDRFAAERATRFTNHVTGSLPCMPARHDILCGSLDFLWKPWGSIEIWEEPITRVLAAQGVTTFLATDHPHLFETGGENFHTDFGGWEYVRGHEGDLWRTHPDPSWTGAPAMPARSGDWFMRQQFGIEGAERGYDRSRTFFKDEADYPGPRTMTEAARFLKEAAPHHDRWFLFVDEFDPHEPFDTPEPWASRYQEQPWDDEWIIWPPYAHGVVTKGAMTEAAGRHIRANYGSKLSMIDHWFGRILSTFDQENLWDDTALIVCTDHGHYLGEMRDGHDIWGKPNVPHYEPLGHTPLLVYWPGQPGGGSIDSLTTNVDIFATISDVFEADVRQVTHGTSLQPILDGSVESVRDWALSGVWGRWVQVTDGTTKYARSAAGENLPLSMFSNRWSTMPTHIPGFAELPAPDQRAWLDTMPGSDIPVIRQPFEAGDRLPFWASSSRYNDQHHLYNLDVDPDEQENRAAKIDDNSSTRPGSDEAEMIDLLHTALAAVDAPTEQLTRLGIP